MAWRPPRKAPQDAGLDELLAPLRADPDAAAVLADVDGTIAPIVERPEDAGVPGADSRGPRSDRRALRAGRLRQRPAGARRAPDRRARSRSPTPATTATSCCCPARTSRVPIPRWTATSETPPTSCESLGAAELERAGIRVEDKGAIVALHWRGAENEGEAESLVGEVAAEAEWAELVTHRGRKVVEIRPNVAINKGIAVAALLASKPGSTPRSTEATTAPTPTRSRR